MHTLWKLARLIILKAVCACANALALFLALPQWARGGFAFRVQDGVLWLECPTMRRGGMVLGPNVGKVRSLEFLGPGYTLRLHELAHCVQAEAACVLGAAMSIVIALEGRPWWGVLMPVTLAWLASAGAAYATAWLRGERTYLDAHIEKAARAASGD